MNILFFSSVFYPGVGGIENLSLSLAKEFVKKGHSVIVITEQKQSQPLEDIHIYHNPGFLKMIKLFRWCNVFYMPNISLKGVWLLLINPFKNWVISHNDYHFVDKVNIKSKLKQVTIKFASRNIAVSRSVASHLHTKSEVIYNCYEDTVFRLYNDEPRIYDFVFVGRLVTYKGCDLLIRACSELKRPYTLNIIGDGPEMNRLRKMVEDLNCNEQIKFLGVRQNEELARMMNRHRHMVVPTIDKEGFGIVVLEGMACGCSIIASDAGGLKEAVDRYGKTFPMGDKDALVKLLNESLDEQSTNMINRDMEEYLRDHTKVVVANKYLSVFNRLN